MQLIKSPNSNGAALVEALLALAFSVAIITAVVIAVITALSNTNFTKNQNLASAYAQEGIDVARNMKDADFQSFSSLTNHTDGTCYSPSADKSTLVIGCTAPVGDIFRREIYVHHGGLDRSLPLPLQKCESGSTFVASIVSWTDPKCKTSNCHKVQLDTCFRDLNRIIGP